MNIYAILPFVCAIFSFVLGTFVLLKNPRLPLNRSFSLLCLETCWWQACWFISYYLTTGTQKDVIIRIAWTLIIFLPFTLFHFIVRFLNLPKKVVWIHRFYLLGIIWLVLLWTGKLFIAGYQEFTWGYYTKAGLLHPFYVTNAAFVLGYSWILLKKSTVDSSPSPIAQNQIKFVFFAITLYFFAAVEYFINYGLGIYPIGVLFILGSFSVIAYTIIKYRLMDIHLVWRQVLISVSYFCAAGACSVLVVFLSYKSFLVGGIFVMILLIIAPTVYRFLQKISRLFVDRIILNGKYSYWEDLRKFWEKTGVVYTSSQLGWALVSKIVNLMELKNCGFFIFDSKKQKFILKAQVGLEEIFGEGDIFSLEMPELDSMFIEYLSCEKDFIIQEDLENKLDRQTLEVSSAMRKMQACLTIPLFSMGKLRGILNLGHKKNGEMFHEQDLQSLKKLVRETENHLSHVLFLEESIFFSAGLAHDLRIPFKGGILYEDIDDIRQDQLTPKQQEAVKDLEDRLELVEKMLNMVVDVHVNLKRFVLGEVKVEEIDYLKLVKNEMKPQIARAEEKGIEFKLLLPKEHCFVYANIIDVSRILNELVNNAIKYTAKGAITIEILKSGLERIVTKVKDTGCGIPAEKLEYVFEPFSRLKMNQQIEGTGIGLAVVKQLVEVYGGQVGVESNTGSGSVFFFTLPLQGGKIR